MCRLASPGHLRLRQARDLEVTYAGAEASVAASVCNFGGRARFVTALPEHALAEATMDTLRAVGIDTQFVLRTDQGRLGLYFLETGANQRLSNVIYDREHSAVAITPGDAYSWDPIFEGAQWLHLSGITPALSKTAAEATLMAAKKAKAAGCQVSIDLNFRKKLWRWEPGTTARELAGKTVRGILSEALDQRGFQPLHPERSRGLGRWIRIRARGALIYPEPVPPFRSGISGTSCGGAPRCAFEAQPRKWLDVP